MNGIKIDSSHAQVEDVQVRLGDLPHHRAMSVSSVASSSVAPTSILGDLSDRSTNDSEDEQEYSPKKIAQVDRYGFTGGTQYTDPNSDLMSVDKIRAREQKWLSMLNNWERWMSRRFPQVKNRCRKGVPPSLRGRAWQLLSGSKALYEQNQGKYAELLKADADPNCIDDIEKDLHRQFPFHEMFTERGGTGQQDLRDVLRAYSVYNKEDGYCQAQAPIAAVLLMHMPAEQAFWCVVAMCEHYLQGYFSPGLEAIQVDGYVMQSLLRKVSPPAYKHLEKNQVTPVLYMTEWFMCVFSRTLPWTSVLRLWDMFFCEGIKVVFRCALVLLRSTLGMSEKLKSLPGLYETMEALRKIDPVCMKEDRLMFEIINLKISERDLEHEHKLQKIKWKKDKSSAPPISNTGKEGKRVYRYTPTYGTDSKYKHKTKSKKNINAISVNSLAIIEQTHKKKDINRKKQMKTDKNEGKAKIQPDKNEDEKKERKALTPNMNKRQANLKPGEVQTRRRSPSGEPVITMFTKSPPNNESNDNVTSVNKNVLQPTGDENKKDEVTVF
uniref:TBC1 domain family member 10A-like n=1 Tax=Styela clava TaxID=7725 RepID=UPI001939773A|nr:TBC1 domain family member 10A-like [Styela clava]